ncbi:GTPase Era [Candidatus Magnetomorum sp. HK-1]|nr:GTPase Era [Candidatus Magnetomorum sp. HK-1]
MSTTSSYKSGFIAILGAPNVGKSTLLNQILGQKVSIISRKPQTTRNRVSGVLHRPNGQMIFLDTPGIHVSERLLNRRMVEIAFSAVSDVDILLIVVDATYQDTSSEKLLKDHLQQQKSPVILAINKIDCIPKEKLLPIIQNYTQWHIFESIIPISAKTGEQLSLLIQEMENRLPQGPPYYPDDHITDLPERFIAAEIIREKVFQLTSKEIPYAVAVTVEEFKEAKNQKMVHILADIHVERDSQKGIIIGKQGSMLKRIGSRARVEIERMTGVQVMLKLFVKVQKNWASDSRALERFGYT